MVSSRVPDICCVETQACAPMRARTFPCSKPTQRKPQRGAGGRRPAFPFVLRRSKVGPSGQSLLGQQQGSLCSVTISCPHAGCPPVVGLLASRPPVTHASPPCQPPGCYPPARCPPAGRSLPARLPSVVQAAPDRHALLKQRSLRSTTVCACRPACRPPAACRRPAVHPCARRPSGADPPSAPAARLPPTARRPPATRPPPECLPGGPACRPSPATRPPRRRLKLVGKLFSPLIFPLIPPLIFPLISPLIPPLMFPLIYPLICPLIFSLENCQFPHVKFRGGISGSRFLARL